MKSSSRPPSASLGSARSDAFFTARDTLTQEEPAEQGESFKVFVRVRPMNERELAHPKKRLKILKVQDNLVHLNDPDMPYNVR